MSGWDGKMRPLLLAAVAVAAGTVTACGAGSAGSGASSSSAPPTSGPPTSATSAATPAPPTPTVTVTVPAPTPTVTIIEQRPAPSIPAAPQDDIGSLTFVLSAHGPAATLTSRTRNADGTVTITGVIDESGAGEYCQRYERAAGAELQACIAKVVSEQGTLVHQATADCAAGTLTTNGPGGGTYAPLGNDTWQNVDTGEVRNSSSAGGGLVLTGNQALACRGQ